MRCPLLMVNLSSPDAMCGTVWPPNLTEGLWHPVLAFIGSHSRTGPPARHASDGFYLEARTAL
jgi:hypothetical protein